MTTLLTLISKQVWPQIMAVAKLKPERVILLHSEHLAESKGPAQRLKRFFEESALSLKGATQVALLSDDDFTTIERQLEELQLRNGINHDDCLLNFTGGNKLMATAAFRWCARRGVRSFYLERRYQITWFEPRDGEIHTRKESLHAHITDGLDPVELLICQLGSAVVRTRGERLGLNQAGRSGHVEDIQAHLRRNYQASDSKLDFRKWLHIHRETDIESREGDNLEYAVAAVLLKLNVPCVYRSVELKPTEATSFTEGELDLVFNWGGRLWVVDCKDKASGKLKLGNLKTALLKEGVNLGRVQGHLNALDRELGEKDIKVLREDLQQIAEVGGSLGNALAIRSAGLPPQAAEFARSHRPQVEVIYKNELVTRLRALLHADAPASPDALAELAALHKKTT